MVYSNFEAKEINISCLWLYEYFEKFKESRNLKFWIFAKVSYTLLNLRWGQEKLRCICSGNRKQREERRGKERTKERGKKKRCLTLNRLWNSLKYRSWMSELEEFWWVLLGLEEFYGLHRLICSSFELWAQPMVKHETERVINVMNSFYFKFICKG